MLFSEEADTDLETDRLLGQHRTDDQGFYDDKLVRLLFFFHIDKFRFNCFLIDGAFLINFIVMGGSGRGVINVI